MRKMKFLGWSLILCMVMALVPTTLMAAETVATIGGVEYESLADAINGASDGDTITLVAGEIPFNAAIAVKKNLTIQGAGMDQTTIKSLSNSAGVFFQIGSASVLTPITVTFKDMTLSGFGDEVTTINPDATVFRLRSDAADGTEFIGKNLRVEKFHRSAFAFFSGSFEISDCVIDCANDNLNHLTKGIQAGNGTAGKATGAVTGTTIINANSTYPTSPSSAIEVYNNADVTIDGCTMTNVQNGVSAARYYTTGKPDVDATATVKNTTISAANNALEVYGNAANTDAGEATLTVESGHFTGGVDINDTGTTDDKCAIIISGGYYFAADSSTTFPIDYLAPGKTAVDSDDPAYKYMIGDPGSGLNTTDHIKYVVGYPDGTVRPTANITRAEVTTMFYRLLTAERRDDIFTVENGFTDVSSTLWYNKAASSMAAGGYILGYPDGSFDGEKAITRGEVVAIAARFMAGQSSTVSFSDVSSNDWAYEYIATAAAYGWIVGYPDGTFHPDQAITRAEVMTIINRMLNRGVDDEGLLDGFKDWPDNPSEEWYYYDVIEATNDHEYTGAKPDEEWASLSTDYEYDIVKYERP